MMESCEYLRTPPTTPSTCLISGWRNKSMLVQFGRRRKLERGFYQNQTTLKQAAAALKSPKGFGRLAEEKKKKKKREKEKEKEKAISKEEEDDDDDDDGVIPEIVTNRMVKRVGLSVGIPLSVGVALFPLFYYVKVGLKIDIPTWVPFIVSFVFFGSALLGVSYGIVSSSWDPLREGSLLGWNEAKRNWPVFWQSIAGGAQRSSSSGSGSGED